MSQTSPCSEKRSVLEEKSPRRGTDSHKDAVNSNNGGSRVLETHLLCWGLFNLGCF